MVTTNGLMVNGNSTMVLPMMTLSLDQISHKPAGNDEYMYDDNASSVKLYSENVVGTGKAGEALPFQNVDEFKDYVIKNFCSKILR